VDALTTTAQKIQTRPRFSCIAIFKVAIAQLFTFRENWEYAIAISAPNAIL